MNVPTWMHALRDRPAHETLRVVQSFIAFFCVLTSYFVIRPVRDQLVAAAGSISLPWFYLATFAVMLALVPVFGLAVARFRRRRLLAVVYGFFVVNLLMFVPAFLAQREAGTFALGVVFFVWVSVFNLFAVSLFWSFMADVFGSREARWSFPMIALGGTSGAIAGPLLTGLLVDRIGVAPLLVVAAALLLVGLLLLLRLAQSDARAHPEDEREIGGGLWAGLRQTFSQPFLRRMAWVMLLGDGVGTLAYALVADYAHAYLPQAAARTAFYAHLDLATNMLVVVLQLSLTPLLLAWRGPLPGLVLPALLNATLLAALALFGHHSLALFGYAVPLVAVLMVVTRAFAYGMVKPASDALYTRVPREARYKGKNFIETSVWRFGDLLVTSLLNALRGLGVGLAAIAGIACLGASVAARVGYAAARCADLAPEPPRTRLRPRPDQPAM